MRKLGLLIGLFCSIGGVNGQTTTSYGYGANTAAPNGTFIGYFSGANTTIGSNNVSIGLYPLYNNTTGSSNVAIGNLSSYYNLSGSGNTAIGDNSLMKNTVGKNTAIGYYSMKSNTTGRENTAVGYKSMESNTTGSYNASNGVYSLSSNVSGSSNTSSGYKSMESNTTGAYNTSNGGKSLAVNTSGDRNTAMGYYTMRDNTTGKWNTGVGFNALNGNETGTGNTTLGYWSGLNAGNYVYSTALGAFSSATASYQVRVGYFGTSSIGGAQNWTNLSDGRFKKEVQEDVLGLDFIKALRPVSYYVDNEAVNEFLGVELEKEAINNKKQYQTGFIAQEVEATAKELGFEHFGGVDAPANEKSHYGLRYAEFVVPLVKSVQELNTQNEAQTTLIEAQAAAIENLKELVEQQQVQINDLLEAKNATLGATTISTSSQAKLHQNIPNPFTNETQINLFVPQEVGQALIQVCTIDGKQLFVKEVEGRNETSIVIEGNNLAAGIYMYTLIVDHEIITSKRMVLTK